MSEAAADAPDWTLTHDDALESESGASHALIDPATGRPLTELPRASLARDRPGHRGRACRASRLEGGRAGRPGPAAAPVRRGRRRAHRRAGPRWRSPTPATPSATPRWEAGNVRDVLNYYSAAPERLFGRQIPVAGGVDITFHEPLGVVGVIVPWNFPMPIAGWGFAPALAAGNTVVLKPAELTPLTAIRLAELALEAGLPEGVFTVIPGQGSVVGERFVTHPLVRKVCFTGSTDGRPADHGRRRRPGEAGDPGARREERQHRLRRRRPGSRRGQRAGFGVRQRRSGLLRPVADPGAAQRVRPVPGLLEPAVQGFRVRAPADPQARDGAADHAPVSWPRLLRTWRARTWPSPAACRVRRSRRGFWYPPTVVLPASPADRIWREEIFGPVVAVLPFEDEADAIAMANDSDFGLSGSIFTADVGRALRVARGVEAGNLSVNSHSSVRYWTPFGGFKQSGPGPGARPGRAGGVHRGQERLHRDRVSRDWYLLSNAGDTSAAAAACSACCLAVTSAFRQPAR